MSKLDDGEETIQKRPQDTAGIAMYGSFTCQTCPEVVAEASLLLEKNILVYRCSQGHTSKAKMGK